MKFSEKIREMAKSYFDILDQEDFSHGFTYVERVTRMAMMIGKKEGADLEIIEAAALLHDIGRANEVIGGKDHAEVGAGLEAKILQDADRLDALGAVDVARVIASSLQSQKHKRPIFVDVPYDEEKDTKKASSAIHYLIKKSKVSKRKPENFNTEVGKKWQRTGLSLC